MSELESFVNRYIHEIKGKKKINEHEESKLIEFMKKFYETVKPFYEGYLTYDIFISNIKDTSEIRELFPYECNLPPIISDNYTRINIPDDGNCLFHAISIYLNSHKNVYNATIVRNEVCNYMVNHRENNIIDKDGNLIMTEEDIKDEYIENMKQDKIFGTNIEITKAAELYNLKIIVHTYYKEQNIEHTSVFNNKATRELHLYNCSTSTNSLQHYELLIPKTNTHEETKKQAKLKAEEQLNEEYIKQLVEQEKNELAKQIDEDKKLAEKLAATHLKKYLKYKQKYLLLKKKYKKN
jgi:hypothetical protein